MPHFRIFAVFFYLASAANSWAAGSPSRPVIIIPGILGSKLCDKTTKELVWGGLGSYGNIKKLQLPLTFTESELRHEPCGLIESVQVLGPVKIHEYDALRDSLLTMGYELNNTLRAFAYDWRLSNYSNATRLATYINTNFPNQDVDIVAHSMGGLIARLYIQKMGGDKKVKRIIFMGTPHNGSANVFKTIDEGWEGWENVAAGGVANIRSAMLSFPSVYQLLPGYQNCCAWRKSGQSRETGYFSAYDKMAWRKFSWLPSELKTAEGRTSLDAMLDVAQQLHNDMQASLPNTIVAVNVVTGLLDTQWKTYFDSTTGSVTAKDLWAGDGTVMEWSASNGRLQDARPATAEHQRIFRGDAPAQVLRWVLASGTEPKAGIVQDVRARIEDAKHAKFDLYSIGFSAAPSYVVAGSKAKAILTLTGHIDLKDADLSNIAFELVTSNGKTPLTVIQDTVSQTDPVVRTLTVEFKGTESEGVSTLRVNLLGLGDLEDQFVTIH